MTYLELRQKQRREQQRWAMALIVAHNGCVRRAADFGGISRGHLYKLIEGKRIKRPRRGVVGNASWQALSCQRRDGLRI